jgi:hypothetical protein
MALIDGGNEPASRLHPNCRRGLQEFYAYLESQVRGEPGGPVQSPEPFQVREEAELVDGPVQAPPPEKPRKHRKRKPPRKADMPAPDRDAITLAKYARTLTGRE